MEALQSIDNNETSTKKGRGQYERKARGGYQKHKTEKKVTVKFYLNKRINFNSKMIDRSDENYQFPPSHPVYIQITFNRKITNIRSATDSVCSNDEEFNELINEELTDNILERERRFIEYYLTNYYKSYLDMHKQNLKEASVDDVELFTEKTFDLDDAMLGFSYDDYELNKEIEKRLKFELYEFAEELTLKEIQQKTGKMELDKSAKEEFKNILINYYHAIQYSIELPESNISALELLSFFEMRKPEFKEMRLRFSSEIWHFNIFYGLLCSSFESQYHELGATILDYTEGDFKNVFQSFFSNVKEKVESIFADIDTLLKKDTF